MPATLTPPPSKPTTADRAPHHPPTPIPTPAAPRPFLYLADPLCILSLALYALNRFYLKPHHLGGAFTHGYLNDLLCLPLFLPIILRLQQLLRLRPNHRPPQLWEILQHALIFSLLFEVLLPQFPHTFATTADPLDALAYLTGGLLAYPLWRLLYRPA